MVALMCEARPLIDWYQLKKCVGRGFDLYVGEVADVAIHLVITGIGPQNMTGAISWLIGRFFSAPECSIYNVWLNVGTAGHTDLPLAMPVRIAQCIGVENNDEKNLSARAHYVPLVSPWDGALGALQTSNSVVESYPNGALVDMEGAAFFYWATRFGPAELVQSIKVISDNRENSANDLNTKKITQLIAPNVPIITQFADGLLGLAQRGSWQNAEKISLQQLSKRIRMTESQRVQLNEMLQNTINAGLDIEFIQQAINQTDDVTHLITSLRESLATCAPVLSSLGASKIGSNKSD